MTKTPTPKKIDRVSAKFGGRKLEFCIPREKLSAFEALTNEPAQTRLAKLLSGSATINDIQEVLEYAAPEGFGRKLPEGRNAAILHMRFDIERMSGRTKPNFVSTVFAEQPPMKYAVLAQGILAAALHGIPETAANFDEDEEDIADV